MIWVTRGSRWAGELLLLYLAYQETGPATAVLLFALTVAAELLAALATLQVEALAIITDALKLRDHE